MSVGLAIKDNFFEMGSSELLHSFFSTISYNLEKDGWGSKFQVLLKKLYYKKIYCEDCKIALEEIKSIHMNFENLTYKDIIWDIDDLDKKVPPEIYVNLKGKKLDNCFICTNGRSFFYMFEDVLNVCINNHMDVEIITLVKFMEKLLE